MLSDNIDPQQVVDHLTNCGIAIEEGPVERHGARER
jgi:hypothetical protein